VQKAICRRRANARNERAGITARIAVLSRVARGACGTWGGRGGAKAIDDPALIDRIAE